MKRNAFITLLAAVLVIGGVIGGAFAGGVAIGKSQGRKEANQELRSRLSQLTSTLGQRGSRQGTPQPSSGLPGSFGGLMDRGGTVEKVEGNIITLNTPQGAVRVVVADNTSIQKMGKGSLDNISPGGSITVSGERNEDGSIQATNIFITPTFTAP